MNLEKKVKFLKAYNEILQQNIKNKDAIIANYENILSNTDLIVDHMISKYECKEIYSVGAEYKSAVIDIVE